MLVVQPLLCYSLAQSSIELSNKSQTEQVLLFNGNLELYNLLTLFARELRASPEVKGSSLYLVELFLNFSINRLTFLEIVKGTHAVVTKQSEQYSPNVAFLLAWIRVC